MGKKMFFGFPTNNYDPDYQAVLNTASSNGFVKPSNQQKLIQNQLVINLKAIGVFQKLDVFHLFASDSSFDFTRINWANRVVAAADSLIFGKVSNSHIFLENGDDRFHTKYTASDNGVNLTLNSASFGWKIKDGTSLNTDNGIIKAGVSGITQSEGALWSYDVNRQRCFINNITALRIGSGRYSEIADSFIVIDRNINDVKLFINGFEDDIVVNSPEKLSEYELNYFPKSQVTKLQFAFAGGHLTATEVSDFKDLMDNYLADILI